MASESAASRKALVSMALPLLASMGTWTNDFWRVSNQVPPAGHVAFDAMNGIFASLEAIQSMPKKKNQMQMQAGRILEIMLACGGRLDRLGGHLSGSRVI